MHPVLIQAFYYGILMIITFAIVGFVLNGFFWTYLKVRLSFGKYVLVKVRSVLRDYYRKGWVEDGQLVYMEKSNGQKAYIRIDLKESNKHNYFYNSIGVKWIDLDESSNSPCYVDYSAVEGFDSKKWSHLLERALYRPSIDSGRDKLILILIIVAIVISLASAYLSYKNGANMQLLVQQLANLKGSIQVGGI